MPLLLALAWQGRPEGRPLRP